MLWNNPPTVYGTLNIQNLPMHLERRNRYLIIAQKTVVVKHNS